MKEYPIIESAGALRYRISDSETADVEFACIRTDFRGYRWKGIEHPANVLWAWRWQMHDGSMHYRLFKTGDPCVWAHADAGCFAEDGE